MASNQISDNFWPKVTEEIRTMTIADLKHQELPIARIKKIMKLDEDVKMISSEVPVLFSKAAELFIHEITMRSWIHTEDNKRSTLQRNDIAMAITKYDQFDFLIDIVPRDDIKPTKVREDYSVKLIPDQTCDVNANGKFLSDKPKLECPSSLEGWTREEVVRQEGKTAGQIDVYFISPDGKRIRSKPDLIRILGDQYDISMVSFKPTTHTGEKPFQCTNCEHQFAKQNQLVTHFRIHTGEKPYLCHNCGQNFRHLSSYRNHRCATSPNRNKNQKLECPSSLEGWTRKEVVRQTGKTAGQVDVYYKSPNGKIIRSKPELTRILGDQYDISMVSFRPTTSQNRNKLDRGLEDSIKCHEACNASETFEVELTDKEALPEDKEGELKDDGLVRVLLDVRTQLLGDDRDFVEDLGNNHCQLNTSPTISKDEENNEDTAIVETEEDASEEDVQSDDAGVDLNIGNHEVWRSTAHFKLPESIDKLPGEILVQLTASPLDTLKKIDITAGIQKSHHIKLLFQCLDKATALKEMDINGSFGNESFSDAINDITLVLSRCTKVSLKQFKETPNFWKKCMAAVKGNCQEFSVIECNGLETVVSMLSGLLPTLIHLKIINPDLEGFRQVREKKLFLSFFKEKVSQNSKLESLVLDKLWGFLLDVPPDIILLALNPLKSFSICRTSLYLPHLLPLLSSWAELSPVSLSVESSWGCWNQLSSDHLVPAVTKISSVSFKGVKLCREVLVSLLSTVSDGCAVKEMDLRGNDMSGISPDILLAAVRKLRVAVFNKCEMDEQTVMKLLRSLADRDCYPELNKDDYQGELEELHLTRAWNTGDQKEEEELVKLVNEREGVSCLEICARDCKCEEYCTWIE